MIKYDHHKLLRVVQVLAIRTVQCSNVFFSKCSVVFAVSKGYFIFMLGMVMFGLVMW